MRISVVSVHQAVLSPYKPSFMLTMTRVTFTARAELASMSRRGARQGHIIHGASFCGCYMTAAMTSEDISATLPSQSVVQSSQHSCAPRGPRVARGRVKGPGVYLITHSWPLLASLALAILRRRGKFRRYRRFIGI